MEAFKALKSVNYAILAGVLVSAASFFVTSIPCKSEKLSLCKLPNPLTGKVIENSSSFYGMSSEPLTGLVVTFLVIFTLTLLICSLIKKQKNKTLDLTNKYNR